jgi:hypothetical protein
MEHTEKNSSNKVSKNISFHRFGAGTSISYCAMADLEVAGMEVKIETGNGTVLTHLGTTGRTWWSGWQFGALVSFATLRTRSTGSS